MNPQEDFNKICDEAQAEYNRAGRPDAYLKYIFKALAWWIRWQIELWMRSESEKKNAPSTPSRKTR